MAASNRNDDRLRDRRAARRRRGAGSGLTRALVVAVLAMGMAWAAGQLVGPGPPEFPAREIALARQGLQDEAATPAGDDVTSGAPEEAAPPAADNGDAAPAGVEDISEAELDEELKAVEQAVQKSRKNPGEEVADKPLPADLGIAWPSDM